MRAQTWVLVFLLGCGGGGDPGSGGTGPSGLAGMYMTTAHTQARPCDGMAENLSLDPPFFRIDDEQAVNGSFLKALPCTGAAPASCDEQAFPLLQVAKNVGGGQYLDEQLSRSPDDRGHCLVTWTGRSARASAGGVTLREESRIGDWSGAQCTADLTDAQVAAARTLDCGFAEILTGKKL
jgi:hypothetical protein